MEYAKQLLTTTDLSAIEIAERCGYTDYSHFSRVFAKYACVSPAKYRKNKP
jgi:AraC family transcriptional regulator of arabinose operon